MLSDWQLSQSISKLAGTANPQLKGKDMEAGDPGNTSGLIWRTYFTI